MKQKISKQISYWLGVVAVGLIAGLGIQFARAWTEPTVAPPGGNLNAPINTSNDGQYKEGNLVIAANNIDPISGLPRANGLIVQNGNVGIGTASPNGKLTISSNASTTEQLRMYYDAAKHGSITVRSDGNLQFYANDGSNYKNILLGVDGTNFGGNVGIGTVNPGEKLDVVAKNYPNMSNKHLAGTVGMAIEGEDTGLQIIGNESSSWKSHIILSGVPASGNNKHWVISHWGPMDGDRFGIQYMESGADNFGMPDSTTDMLAILPSGKVGIGTTNPQQKLEVSSVMRLTPTDSPGTCSAAQKGSIYWDTSVGGLCDCNGASWQQVDGNGAC